MTVFFEPIFFGLYDYVLRIDNLHFAEKFICILRKILFTFCGFAATISRDRMIAGGVQRPACLAVVTGGGFARLRDDGVYVLPINAIRH